MLVLKDQERTVNFPEKTGSVLSPSWQFLGTVKRQYPPGKYQYTEHPAKRSHERNIFEEFQTGGEETIKIEGREVYAVRLQPHLSQQIFILGNHLPGNQGNQYLNLPGLLFLNHLVIKVHVIY